MEKPVNANFSSGSCAKRFGWSLPKGMLVGRSHRSAGGLKLIRDVVSLERRVLKIPDDYFVGIVTASSTGAMEALLWSLLGERGVDVLACCVFSDYWAHDIVNELGISDTRLIAEKFPRLSEISSANFDRDVVFCLSSTTSGASFCDLSSIPDDRGGLVICDATSAVFTMDFDWAKLDAVAFSWQKGLGGEAGLGTIAISPRSITRLESYRPNRPIPRIFKIADDRKINTSLFNGFTINTPSMICLEDMRSNLIWSDNLGGIVGLTNRVEQNYNTIKNWVSNQRKFRFFVEEKYRSRHVICLDIISDTYQSMSDDNKWSFLKRIVAFCEKEKVGFDFLGHILTKPNLRIWAGPTIDYKDLEKFLPWLECAYEKLSAECF